MQTSLTKREEGLATAAKAEGVEKAKLLHAVLQDLPPEYLDPFYDEVTKELIANDPEDETGYAAAWKYDQALVAFESTIEKHIGGGEFDEILKAADAFVAEHQPEGLQKQQILMAKVMVHAERREAEAAFQQLDEIKALAPESEIGAQVDAMKQGLASFLSEESSEEEGSAE